ncbi:hypothetical protein BT96DRAFT_924075 [Gymnopus androsaceus JB14]|uniref:Uncharacterized protein n=1 Tax=Gymnopus androsaceus JB14 TaxID=1447944 RepID=A0A6A4H879_9AGAR|nr:hypothetical protein BT96DRAFT_924075 [Gymnopus androsaceus JB14]
MLVTPYLSVFLMFILSIVSIAWTYAFLEFFQTLRPKSENNQIEKKDVYSFQGYDIPEILQMDFNGFVAMSAEETLHFAATDEAEDEWTPLEPYGRGVVRQGPDQRAFLLSVFHQLHCLHYIEVELTSASDMAHWPHVQHCLNMIRQWVICEADVTLEQGFFARRNFTADRWGETYVCRDWEAVYAEMKRNWIEFYQYQLKHGIPTTPFNST